MSDTSIDPARIEAVRRSIGEPEPAVDPFRDWIGGSDAAPARVDDVVYGS